jgi:hypothetical protein
VEGNCHFWAFPGAKASTSGRASEPMSSPRAPVWPARAEVQGSHLASQGHPRGRFMKLWNGVGNFRFGLFPSSKSAQESARGSARPVRMYCFRFDTCGTVIPLSGVRSVSRIAVVWTRFIAAISPSPSIHVNVLFTHAFVLSAVVCE